MALTVDQSQLTGTSGVGFGQFTGVRYRVQGFTPTVARIDGAGFYFNGSKGSAGMRVELQALAGGAPDGVALASAQLTNAQLSASASIENLFPLVHSGLTPGVQYALVLMPWDTTTGTYVDNYRDMVHQTGGTAYPGGYWKYENGAFRAESLDFKFSTYYDADLLTPPPAPASSGFLAFFP